MPTLAGKTELFSVAVAASLTYMAANSQIQFSSLDINDIGTVIAGAAGTLLGFLMTAIALMASIMDRDLLKNLRATGGFSVLMRRAFTSAGLQLLLLIVAISLLYPWGDEYKKTVVLLLLFVSSVAFTYLFCVGSSFYQILMRVSRR